MNYIYQLTQAATTAVLEKSGRNLPFTIGKATGKHSIWDTFDGVKRDDNSSLTIFVYNKQINQRYTQLANNALRKLRTLRHPQILKYVDAIETDTMIYIATERATPLSTFLPSDDTIWLTWGLQNISQALSFLHTLTNSIHGAVSSDSIFISESGEWKLGGFELATSQSELSNGILEGNYDRKTAAPEARQGFDAISSNPVSSLDSYSFALLISQLYNPTKPLPLDLTSAPPPSSKGMIPTSLFNAYKKLLHPSPKSRLSVDGFLQLGNNSQDTQNGAFFTQNPLIELCQGLEVFSLMRQAERVVFLKNLSQLLNYDNSSGNILGERKVSIPNSLAIHRILPTLVHSVEFMTAGDSAPSLVPLIVRIGMRLDTEDERSKAISKPLLRLWMSPDRGTRMALLEDLERYIDVLSNKIVVNELWPQLITGFNDTAAVLREATIKAVPLISSKLSDRILNNELLKQLAKAQLDPEPSIRTNTCILIGKLTPKLALATRKKVLVSACARAMKDSFAPARAAGLRTLLATVDDQEENDLATRVLPTICPCLLDKEKSVRDQAFDVLRSIIARVESIASKMPETAIKADSEIDYSYSGTAGKSFLGDDQLGNAASAIAGWAFGTSTTTKKLEANEATTAMTSAGPTLPLSPSAPSHSSSLSTSYAEKPTSSSSGGMKLSGQKPTLDSLLSLSNETNDDGWGDLDEEQPKSIPTIPKIHTNELSKSPSPASAPIKQGPAAPSLQPMKPTQSTRLNVAGPSLSRAHSTNNATSTQENSKTVQKSPSLNALIPSPPTTLSMPLSKEEKAQELARKKEERAQKIAQIKAAKAAANSGSLI
ncbi:ARM repeat-containing protein [Wallemia mellicola]|nr:ARM repeat-containing protein [Wallemia mellicola]